MAMIILAYIAGFLSAVVAGGIIYQREDPEGWRKR